MIEYRDVQAAQARIAPTSSARPLLRVPALDEALGCQVYLKHEGFQTIGAFKLRGALNKAPLPVGGGSWAAAWCAPPRATTPRG